MAYNDNGEWVGFAPEWDEEDKDALAQVDRLEQAQIHRGRQKFVAHQQGQFSAGFEDAMKEFGVTPEQLEMMAASDPQETGVVNRTSGYMTAKSIIQGAQARAGQRPRDKDGRFASPKQAAAPKQSPAKDRKTLQEYRDRVSKEGKISGDSDEAIDILEALLSQ